MKPMYILGLAFIGAAMSAHAEDNSQGTCKIEVHAKSRKFEGLTYVIDMVAHQVEESARDVVACVELAKLYSSNEKIEEVVNAQHGNKYRFKYLDFSYKGEGLKTTGRIKPE